MVADDGYLPEGEYKMAERRRLGLLAFCGVAGGLFVAAGVSAEAGAAHAAHSCGYRVIRDAAIHAKPSGGSDVMGRATVHREFVSADCTAEVRGGITWVMGLDPHSSQSARGWVNKADLRMTSRQ